MHDGNENNEECQQYLNKILDIFLNTITNSPGEGVGARQAEPTGGVGSQALPIPGCEYDEYSREWDGLLDGGVRKAKFSISAVGRNPTKSKKV